MATINYKCDTCGRELERLENKVGLTVFGSCSITKNCRGTLYKIKRNQNNIRENLPKYDRELDDYTKRALFFNHTQLITSDTWVIKHGFGNSCVFVAYDALGNVINESNYTVKTNLGESVIKFTSAYGGFMHVLSRTGYDSTYLAPMVVLPDVQISYSDILTFAVPKYITRINSGSVPLIPPPNFPVTPSPTAVALPSTPLDTSIGIIRIEVEVTRPNEETVQCIEILDANISPISAWSNWHSILVRNRKHYNVKTMQLTKMKVFANTNNQQVIIPNGTIIKILRIDYGTGLLVNIPDRGLFVLMSNPPHKSPDKDVNNIIDCGEMVSAYIPMFVFRDYDLYCDNDTVEKTFPKITKY